MGRGRTALNARAIERRTSALARARGRWTVQDLITAGTDALIHRKISGGQDPGCPAVVPIKQEEGLLGQEREYGAQLGGAHGDRMLGRRDALVVATRWWSRMYVQLLTCWGSTTSAEKLQPATTGVASWGRLGQ